MKKGYCKRCGEYRYINNHHIFPQKFFEDKDNKDTIALCLECHAEIHEKLPKEQKEKSFYLEFTKKFIGLVLFLVLIITTIRFIP